jgi:hypothetical protein
VTPNGNIYGNQWVAGKGLFRSMDHGFTWQEIFSATFPDTHNVCGFAIHPENESIIFANSGAIDRAWGGASVELGKFYKSTDAGATWEAKGQYDGFNIYIEPNSPNVMLMNTGDYDANGDGIYEGIIRSMDGGDTWQSIHGNAPNYFTWGFVYGRKPGRVFMFNMGMAMIEHIQEEEYIVPVDKPIQPGLKILPGINIASFPNPFVHAAKISYQLNSDYSIPVDVTVFNCRGEKIKTLYNSCQSAGAYQLFWDGSNNTGMQCANSTYFCRVTAGDKTATSKIVMNK